MNNFVQFMTVLPLHLQIISLHTDNYLLINAMPNPLNIVTAGHYYTNKYTHTCRERRRLRKTKTFKLH